MYDEILFYLVKKFPKFKTYKNLIKNQIIARINNKALTKEFDSSFSKFNLSANYGWKEKTESENKNTHELKLTDLTDEELDKRIKDLSK